MKEEFEKWAKAQHKNISPNLIEDEYGFDYFDLETQYFWECWQAAWGAVFDVLQTELDGGYRLPDVRIPGVLREKLR